jgi:hypothetical protein
MPSDIEYSPEEWALLNELPFKVILAAAVVDVKGPIGAASKEMVYGARKLVREAKANYSGNRIIAESLAAAANDDGNNDEISLDDELARQAAIVEALSLSERAAILLGDHDDADQSTQYQQWVFDGARAAAAATKSGGFLGIGAEDISDAEEEFLTQLKNALGLSDPDE